MRFGHVFGALVSLASVSRGAPTLQIPLVQHGSGNHSISVKLFAELEELARIVDISYCVGMTGLGIQKPFQCVSRCSDFENFELVTTWNTGPLLSDSCGYIALSKPPSPPRIIVAFRGTYSIANTIVDLSTVPQEYVPYPGDDDSGRLGDRGIVPPHTLDRLSHPDKQESEHGKPKVRDTDQPHILEHMTGSEGEPPPSNPPRCEDCTVHTGFYASWLHTRNEILEQLSEAIAAHPSYQLTLVGHSLGGAVATLAALDFKARGWDPVITTFGEPRVGNDALVRYIDARFNLSSDTWLYTDAKMRRVTHVDDPVPLLPLSEWGYRMHAGELFIQKPDLPPSVVDIRHCAGDEDPTCIAGNDADAQAMEGLRMLVSKGNLTEDQSWTFPTRFKLWQLFFAHRDYFWRLGLCVPGGNPWDWYRKYPHPHPQDGDEL